MPVRHRLPQPIAHVQAQAHPVLPSFAPLLVPLPHTSTPPPFTDAQCKTPRGHARSRSHPRTRSPSAAAARSARAPPGCRPRSAGSRAGSRGWARGSRPRETGPATLSSCAHARTHAPGPEAGDPLPAPEMGTGYPAHGAGAWRAGLVPGAGLVAAASCACSALLHTRLSWVVRICAGYPESTVGSSSMIKYLVGFYGNMPWQPECTLPQT